MRYMGRIATGETKIIGRGLRLFLFINENTHDIRKYEKNKFASKYGTSATEG
jgi:hypothetical protein